MEFQVQSEANPVHSFQPGRGQPRLQVVGPAPNNEEEVEVQLRLLAKKGGSPGCGRSGRPENRRYGCGIPMPPWPPST